MKLLFKYFFIIIVICFPNIISAQEKIDTISSKEIVKKFRFFQKPLFFNVNDSKTPINNMFIIEYHSKCKDKPKYIREMRGGTVELTKRFIYYFNTCNVSEIYSVNKGNDKIGDYYKFSPDGKIQVHGKYNEKGNKDGLFTKYNYSTNVNVLRKYSNGNRIVRYYSTDTINLEIKKTKNIISFDLICLSFQTYKLYYERYLGNNDYLKVEFEAKPKSAHHATEIFSLYNNANTYIEFAHKRYLFGVDYEKFLDKKNHSFYLSIGLYYLNKSYDSLYFHDYHGDGEPNFTYLQSEYSKSSGIRTLLGRKFIVGNVKHKIHEVIDVYLGLGLCQVKSKKSVYGFAYHYNYDNPSIVYYPDPKVSSRSYSMISVFAGLRFGIGW
jgi:hypothetical protein